MCSSKTMPAAVLREAANQQRARNLLTEITISNRRTCEGPHGGEGVSTFERRHSQTQRSTSVVSHDRKNQRNRQTEDGSFYCCCTVTTTLALIIVHQLAPAGLTPLPPRMGTTLKMSWSGRTSQHALVWCVGAPWFSGLG